MSPDPDGRTSRATASTLPDPRARRTRDPQVGATDHAIQSLTQAIRDGAYGAGERLVESRLTRELGISRGSLREALRRLAADGLIDLEPHRGAVVRRIDRQTVADLLTVREVLEGLAAALAARASSAESVRQRLRERLARVRGLRAEPGAIDFLQDNLEFHRFIVALAGNTVLAQQIQQLQLPAVRSRFFAQLGDDDWRRSLGEHEAMLEAMLDGDAPLAEQLMRAHIRRTRRLFEKLPDEVFDSCADVAHANDGRLAAPAPLP
jgi:DNA-binding GntR family transcriptional regulator